MAEAARGYLILTAIESSGRNKDDAYVWGSSESESFEGYVKVELRGGARNVKVATRRAPVQGSTIFWNEPLVLEVLDNSNELRIMLCRDKVTQLPDGSTKRGTQVVAACGIFVSDILDAVPIDKYFELFKPGAGGEGGFIRLGLDYSTEAPQLARDVYRGAGGTQKKRRGLLAPLLLLAAAVGGGILGKRIYDERQKKDGSGGKAANSGKGGAAKKK